jgi:hypothetical protein
VIWKERAEDQAAVEADTISSPVFALVLESYTKGERYGHPRLVAPLIVL